MPFKIGSGILNRAGHYEPGKDFLHWQGEIISPATIIFSSGSGCSVVRNESFDQNRVVFLMFDQSPKPERGTGFCGQWGCAVIIAQEIDLLFAFIDGKCFTGRKLRLVQVEF